MEDFFNSGAQQTESLDYQKYLRALLKYWWLVGGLFLLIFIPWYLNVKKQPFLYEAEAIISFENFTGNISSSELDNRTTKMKSRSFAEEATQKLGLTLQIINDEKLDTSFTRHNIFTEFWTNKEPVSGYYSIQFYQNHYYTISYGTEKLDSLLFNKEEQVQYANEEYGIYFKLNPEIFSYYDPVYFKIKPFQQTVISLRDREVIRSSQNGDIMSLSLSDKNPVLAYQTVNMLAELFVNKSYEMNKESTQSLRDYLKEQLDYVQKDLNQSDMDLKIFRQNHVVGLDEKTEEMVTEMQRLEAQKKEMEISRDVLTILLEKLSPSVEDVDIELNSKFVFNQIISNSLFAENPQMRILHDEYRMLEEDRDELAETYPETHPAVIELNNKLYEVEDRILVETNKKMNEIAEDLQTVDHEMDSLQRQLLLLPGEEIRLVQLTRGRRANEEIYNMLLKRFREAQISEAVVSQRAYILDPAIIPTQPLSSDKNKKILMGLMLALGFSFGTVFIIGIMDKKIHSHEDVKRYLKLPIIGTIPKVKFDEYELQDSEKAKSISSQIVTHDYSPTPVGEAYRALRTNLLFNKDFGNVKSMIIGSASPGEGKSFTATNLAITMAQQKSRTLLIDTDLRRGVLHNTFNVPKKPGLTNYLTGMASLEEVLNETYVPNLNLITCGSMIPNPSELMGSQNMAKFVENLKKKYDFIIFDTPPLFAASDAVILGSLVDGVGILVRSNVTNWEKVKRKLELFQNVRIKVFGIILNCAGVEVAHDGYSYYSY